MISFQITFGSYFLTGIPGQLTFPFLQLTCRGHCVEVMTEKRLLLSAKDLLHLTRIDVVQPMTPCSGKQMVITQLYESI